MTQYGPFGQGLDTYRQSPLQARTSHDWDCS